MFSRAKISCTYDHVKPIIQMFNLNQTLLHAGTNTINGGQAVCQVSGSIIDLALSLKSKKSTLLLRILLITLS